MSSAVSAGFQRCSFEVENQLRRSSCDQTDMAQLVVCARLC